MKVTEWRTRYFWRTGTAYSIQLFGRWFGVEFGVDPIAFYFVPLNGPVQFWEFAKYTFVQHRAIAAKISQ